MDRCLQRLQQTIASATEGMTAEELRRHQEGKWSVAEVLEHLLLTYSGSVKGFERCLAGGKPLGGSPTLKQRLAIAAVTRAGYFPKGRKSPSFACPRGRAADEIVKEIGPKIAALDELIAQCEARFGKRTRVLDHHVIGPLTGRQWRKFHWVHGRHHMKQIRNLRRARLR